MICNYRQWKISQAVDGAHPLPAWLRRHVSTCPNCAAHYEKQRLVAAQLTRSGETMPEAPPFLKERIIDSLPGNEPSLTQWIMPQWVKVSIGVTAIVALAIALNQTDNPTSPVAQPMPSPSANTQPQDAIKTTIPALPQPAVQTALTQVSDTLTEPYETEFKNLKNDLTETRNFLSDRLSRLSLAGFKANP